MMNIRRFSIRLLAMLAYLLLCAASAAAEENRWKAEYQAYGHTIRVDTEITVPEKDSFPFLAVEPMNELSAEDAEQYSTEFASLDLEQQSGEHNFFSRKSLIYIQYSDHTSHPDLSDAEKVTTPNRPLYMYDRDKAYAEDNDLTVREAEELIRENIRTIYRVCLGYAQYDLPEGSPYESVLAPAWVFWTGWMDDPAEESGSEKSVNGTDYAAGCSYLPIIVNAVTGKVTDPLDESEGRMLLPEGCMKWIR